MNKTKSLLFPLFMFGGFLAGDYLYISLFKKNDEDYTGIFFTRNSGLLSLNYAPAIIAIVTLLIFWKFGYFDDMIGGNNTQSEGLQKVNYEIESTSESTMKTPAWKKQTRVHKIKKGNL